MPSSGSHPGSTSPFGEHREPISGLQEHSEELHTPLRTPCSTQGWRKSYIGRGLDYILYLHNGALETNLATYEPLGTWGADGKSNGGKMLLEGDTPGPYSWP